jgi:predicted metal-dependent peptidase
VSKVMKSEKTEKLVAREFTQTEKNKIVEKLITARIALLLRHPFFGNLATRLELVDATNWCSTLATDGRRFYYNLDFVNRLTPKQVEFGFAHEVLHCVFDHMGRTEHRDRQLANIAADFTVNQITKDEGIGEFPDFIKVFQDNKYRGWSFEEVYEDIKKRAIKINIKSLGELLDEHLQPDENGDAEDEDGENDGDKKDGGKGKRPRLTDEERKKIRDEFKEAVISAAQSVEAGKIPAGIKRLIGDLTEPVMDWRQILRVTIQSVIKSDFSFTRPNRKSQHTGAVLPGMRNEETVDLCLCFDMSGSIGDDVAREMISEVKGIMEEFKDFKIKLWCFDTEVYNYAEFDGDNAEDLLEYKIKGGGGTDFECNWKYMKKHGIEPKKFIVFTDGYPCGSWGDENYCDTLFIIHGNNKIVAPFGQTAYYE